MSTPPDSTCDMQNILVIPNLRRYVQPNDERRARLVTELKTSSATLHYTATQDQSLWDNIQKIACPVRSGETFDFDKLENDRWIILKRTRNARPDENAKCGKTFTFGVEIDRLEGNFVKSPSSLVGHFSCTLMNGNLSGNAAVTINKLTDASLIINDGTLSFDTFTAKSGQNLIYSPQKYLSASDFEPSGRYAISPDGQYLTTAFHYTGGGSSSMTDGEVVGTFDRNTQQFHVQTKTGFGIFKTLKLDFLLQCL